MATLLQFVAGWLDQGVKLLPRMRAIAVYLRTGIKFKRVGRHAKVYGSKRMQVGRGVAIGDNCWVEAVTRYQGVAHNPRLVIGDRVALSDLTHISCVEHIRIGDDCLFGSKIYVGDHNHGSVGNLEQILRVAPAARPLGDAAEIVIGEKTWIGDGAVILPGTRIGRSSIVGANSVVHLREERPALIAGIPAKIIRYLDGNDHDGAR
jgi:acetyltransferase-like isoleucine patch superfamily enzyme